MAALGDGAAGDGARCWAPRSGGRCCCRLRIGPKLRRPRLRRCRRSAAAAATTARSARYQGAEAVAALTVGRGRASREVGWSATGGLRSRGEIVCCWFAGAPPQPARHGRSRVHGGGSWRRRSQRRGARKWHVQSRLQQKGELTPGASGCRRKGFMPPHASSTSTVLPGSVRPRRGARGKGAASSSCCCCCCCCCCSSTPSSSSAHPPLLLPRLVWRPQWHVEAACGCAPGGSGGSKCCGE